MNAPKKPDEIPSDKNDIPAGLEMIEAVFDATAAARQFRYLDFPLDDVPDELLEKALQGLDRAEIDVRAGADRVRRELLGREHNPDRKVP